MSDELQIMYDRGWKSFHEWAADSSNKIMSDEGVGREYGDKLRELAADKVGTAAMKGAYAQGWRANKPYRDSLESQVEELTRDLAAAREELAAANATVAQCKQAGFIDEQGNVCGVTGTLVKTKDGVIATFGAQVYHPKSVWKVGLDVYVNDDGPSVSVPTKTASDGFVSQREHFCVSECYSTPEAAQVARQQEQSQ